MNALPILGVIVLGIILGLVWYIRKIKNESPGGIAPSQLALYSNKASVSTDLSRDHLEDFLAKSSIAKARRLRLRGSRRNKQFAIILVIGAALVFAFINRAVIQKTVEDVFSSVGQALQGSPDNGGSDTPSNQTEAACTKLVFNKDSSGNVGLHSLPEIADQPTCYEIPDVKVWNSWFDDQQNKVAASARQSLAKSIVESSSADTSLIEPVIQAIVDAGNSGVLHLPSKSGEAAKPASEPSQPDNSGQSTPNHSANPDCGTAAIKNGSIALDPQISKNGSNCWNVQDQASWKKFFTTAQTANGKTLSAEFINESFASFIISSHAGLDAGVDQCKDKKYTAACSQIKQAVQDSFTTGILNFESLP